MSPQSVAVGIVCLLFLNYGLVSPYKDLEEYQKQLREIKNSEFGVSETLLTKAFKFINSDKNMMGMVADELWNIGEKTIDTIVDVEAKKRKLDEKKSTYVH